MDIDLSDQTIQAAMNTLVTCPYCSESYYYADALSFDNGRFTVQCPECHVSPAEDAAEEYHELIKKLNKIEINFIKTYNKYHKNRNSKKRKW